MERDLQDSLRRLENQEYELVHKAAIALIHLDADNPVPYYLLGRIAFEHQNFPKAAELFQRARELAPTDAFYLAAYSQYLLQVGEQSQAVLVADEATALAIKDAFTADTIGVVYSRTGLHEKAVPMFERAVELNPAPANFHYNLGASLQFCGDFTRAEAAYRATLERDPAAYRACTGLVALSSESISLETLTDLYEKMSSDADAALHLAHAIASTLESQQRYEESFDWLVRGKQKKRASLNYQAQTDLQLFAASSATATASHTEEQTAYSQAAPVFIVGLPRTGTTLVDRILSSHPDLVSVGELNTFAGLVKSASNTKSNLVLDIETLARAARIDFAKLGKAYIADTQRLTCEAPRFADKMPLNFFYAALIHRALPNARIVILRRDPIDSCLSNFRQLFSTSYSYYNYTLSIEDTAEYYAAFDELMKHWLANLPAERCAEFRYEDFVQNQEQQTRRLLKFCGLSWDEACLQFHENSAPVSTASSVQVRQPLYATSIGRWKKYGSRLDSVRNRLKHLY